MEPEKQECPYFSKCGGCSTQHIPYDLQLKNKRDFVSKLLAGLQEIENKDAIISGMQVFYDSPLHYRNRMDFVFFSGGIGLRKERSYDKIVSVRDCAIANQRLDSLLKEVWQWYDRNRAVINTFDIRGKKGTLRYAVIRASEFSNSSSISFVINSDSEKQAAQLELIRDFAKNSSADNVIVARVPKNTDESISSDCFAVKGGLMLDETLCSSRLFFHSQGFFQNNPRMAEKMVQHTAGILDKYSTKDSMLIDLYGGVGTFGINLSARFRETLIVESVAESIECAKLNIKENSAVAGAVCLDASQLKKILPEIKSKSFVITDPPRTGMHPNTIKALLELKPEAIIYVSCNPRQMMKELKLLLNDYSLESIALFDLFPQTNHIECVAELKQK